MTERFDAIVIGMGPGGEVAASRLLAAGRRVVVIERELIGGECGYWVCVPSKTLVRPPEARGEVDRAATCMPLPKDLPASLLQHGHCRLLCLLHQNLSARFRTH